MATGYMHGLNGLVLADLEKMSNRLGAGDLISTSEDLNRFQRALGGNDGRILSKKYWDLLFAPQGRFGAVEMTYIGALYSSGNGENKMTVLGVGEGSRFGFRSRMTRFMELGASYVVLSNVQSDRAMTQAMYNYLGDLLVEERRGTVSGGSNLSELSRLTSMLPSAPNRLTRDMRFDADARCPHSN